MGLNGEGWEERSARASEGARGTRNRDRLGRLGRGVSELFVMPIKEPEMKHNERKDFSDVLMSHQALESLSLPSEGISKDCYHHQVSHV